MPEISQHFYPNPDGGKPIKRAPTIQRPIKPVERTMWYVVDPSKPNGTSNKWKMVETTDGVPPMFDNLYLPKFLRRNGSRGAMPLRMKVTILVEYSSVDPGPELSPTVP